MVLYLITNYGIFSLPEWLESESVLVRVLQREATIAQIDLENRDQDRDTDRGL